MIAGDFARERDGGGDGGVWRDAIERVDLVGADAQNVEQRHGH